MVPVGKIAQNNSAWLPEPFGEKLTILNSVSFLQPLSLPFLLNGGFGLFFFNPISLFPAFSPSLCHACNRHQQTVIQCSSFAPKNSEVLREGQPKVSTWRLHARRPLHPSPSFTAAFKDLLVHPSLSLGPWAFGGSGWVVFYWSPCSTSVICLKGYMRQRLECAGSLTEKSKCEHQFTKWLINGYLFDFLKLLFI